MDAIVITTIEIGLAAVIAALAYLIYEFDKFTQRPALVLASRRPTLATGKVSSRNPYIAVVNGTTVALRTKMPRGSRVALVWDEEDR